MTVLAEPAVADDVPAAADPRPPYGTRMLILEDGRAREGSVRQWGTGPRYFAVVDDTAPYVWHDLTVGDPRIIEPAEYGPKPKGRQR